jgi:hypothetical protein
MSRFADWVCRAGLAVCTVVLCGIPVIWLTYEMQPVAAGLCLAACSILLPLALLAPLERLTKGLFLVGLAVLSAALYSTTVGPMFALLKAENGVIVSSTGQFVACHEYFSTGTIGEWLLKKLNLTQVEFLTQAGKLFDSFIVFMNLACAGAGGSLIAVEGDRRSKVIPIDKEQAAVTPLSPIPAAISDPTRMIRSLIAEMNSQTEMLARLSAQVCTLEQRISMLIVQQARFRRKVVIAAIIGAAALGLAIGGAVFIRMIVLGSA